MGGIFVDSPQPQAHLVTLSLKLVIIVCITCGVLYAEIYCCLELSLKYLLLVLFQAKYSIAEFISKVVACVFQ